MFFYTFKANKKAVIGASLVVLALIILFLVFPSHPKTESVSAKANINASTNAERIAFIANFGYDVIEEPLETRDVVIPEQFDNTYKRYNELQLSQGFDLSKFKGKSVKSFSYAVTNYPGIENSEKTVRANLLVYNSEIIGGDICSVELDGFMHEFDYGKT